MHGAMRNLIEEFFGDPFGALFGGHREDLWGAPWEAFWEAPWEGSLGAPCTVFVRVLGVDKKFNPVKNPVGVYARQMVGGASLLCNKSLFGEQFLNAGWWA